MDEPLDPPWPGDMTDSDWVADRQAKRESLSREAIRDILGDTATDDAMVDMVRRLVVLRDHRMPEHCAIGGALCERIAAEVERWLDREET